MAARHPVAAAAGDAALIRRQDPAVGKRDQVPLQRIEAEGVCDLDGGELACAMAWACRDP
ncbi:MAG: hypothetical protein P4M07_28515 [Xanthobacteraceae bacterium]|nr:hypothetical protein [Xanthobacteraceae bacterium]